MVKKLLLFINTIILFLFCDTSYAIYGDNKVIEAMGFEKHPPFEFINKNGELDGFNIDIFKAIMKNAGISYELRLGDKEKVISSIALNKIDVIIGVLNTEERAKIMRFCIPYCGVNRNIVTRKDSKIVNIELLKGKEVIVQKDSWGEQYINEVKLANQIIVVNSIEEGLDLLSSGKYDALITSNLVALSIIKEKSFDNLEIHTTNLPPQNFSMAVNKSNEMLLAAINLGLQNLKISGEYDKIYNKWFGVYSTKISSRTIHIVIAVFCLFLLIAFGLVYLMKKKIEKAVSKVEEIKTDFQLGLKAGNFSMWAYDPDKKMFSSLYGNPIAANGLFLDDFLSQVHPEDVDILLKKMKKVLETENANESMMLRYKNLGADYIYLQSELISKWDKVNNKHCIVGTQKDVTDEFVKDMERREISLALGMAVKSARLRVSYYNVFDDHYYLLVNNKFEKTVYTLESYVENIHPEDVEIYHQLLGDLINGFTDSEEYTLRLKNKSKAYDYYESCMVALKDASGKTYRIAINQRNITKKYLHNMKIENMRKSLDMAMDVAEITAWDYTVATKKYRTLYGNEIYEHSNNFKLSLVHPNDKGKYINYLNSLLEGESESEKFVIRMKDPKNGNYGYFENVIISVRDVDGIIAGLVGSTKNITLQQKTEMSLMEKKERLDQINKQNFLILNNMNSGLAYIRTDYVVDWENVSVCLRSIKSNAYMMGKHCYETAFGRTEPCEDCPMSEVFKSNKMVRVEKILGPDKRIFEIVAIPVFLDEKKIEGVVMRLDDITERKRIYKELEQEKIKAKQSDKLKSLFIANMSHEIRTPLNAIIGFSSLLQEEENKDQRNEYIRIINNNNEMLLKLISDILDLSQIESGIMNMNMKQCNFSSLFEDAAMSFYPRIGVKDITFICENQYESCMIELDEHYFLQVLTNIISNAIKFTSQGEIKMWYLCEDNGIRFYVSDTGVGIAKEDIPKVFGRFEKLNSFSQGVGLGLSISKAIVGAFHGTIDIESELGKGTTLIVWFPCNPVVELRKQVKIMSYKGNKDLEK